MKTYHGTMFYAVRGRKISSFTAPGARFTARFTITTETRAGTLPMTGPASRVIRANGCR